jgi:hypothetical protein
VKQPNCTFLTHSQPRDCADYRHRVLWPATALGKITNSIAIQMTHPDVIRIATTSDVLIICMAIDEVLQEVVSIRKLKGLPTVFEISDDFQSFPENTQMAPFYAQPAVQNRLMSLASFCDAVQFSSPHLMEKYQFLNPVTTVFMNQVWKLPTPKEKGAGEVVRIGWTASAGHIEDGISLGKQLKEGLEGIPVSSYHLSAMTTPKVISALRQSGIIIEHVPTGSWEKYLAYLSSLDIGLAHLSKDDFALGRSDGKYIEYASQGVVALCSKAGTFQHTINSGQNGLLYNSTADFGSKLKELIEDQNLRSSLRANAYQDLIQVRNHQAASKDRLEFYRSLCKTVSNKPIGFQHAIDPIEAKLMLLMEKQNEKPSKDLIKSYQNLIKNRPNAYQSWQYLYLLFKALDIHKKREWLYQKSEQLRKDALQDARRILEERP